MCRLRAHLQIAVPFAELHIAAVRGGRVLVLLLIYVVLKHWCYIMIKPYHYTLYLNIFPRRQEAPPWRVTAPQNLAGRPGLEGRGLLGEGVDPVEK